jgi:hypothetical protein
MITKIFGHIRDEVTEPCRILRNNELSDLFRSSNITGAGVAHRYSDWARGWMTDVRFPAELVFAITFRPAPGPTQTFNQSLWHDA